LIRLRAVTALALSPIFVTLPLRGAPVKVDFSTYRTFHFGSSVAVTAKQAGLQTSDAKIIHQRPAVIQEMEWRPAYVYTPSTEKADPVREGLLRFYNGALFQIVTTYDRQKVEGMSESDMVQALSLAYGTASKPGGEVTFHSYYGETAPVIARWEDSDYSYNLIRTGDQSSFALIMSQKRLEMDAQNAILAANKSEALEAPQKAKDLQTKQESDARLQLNKARSVNVPNFRP
jgi:hypothetical protein